MVLCEMGVRQAFCCRQLHVVYITNVFPSGVVVPRVQSLLWITSTGYNLRFAPLFLRFTCGVCDWFYFFAFPASGHVLGWQEGGKQGPPSSTSMGVHSFA